MLLGAASLATAGGLNVFVNVGGNRGYCPPAPVYCPPVYQAPVYYAPAPVVYYNTPAAVYGNGFTTYRTVPVAPVYYNTVPNYRVVPPLQPVPVQAGNFGWRR